MLWYCVLSKLEAVALWFGHINRFNSRPIISVQRESILAHQRGSVKCFAAPSALRLTRAVRRGKRLGGIAVNLDRAGSECPAVGTNMAQLIEDLKSEIAELVARLTGNMIQD